MEDLSEDTLMDDSFFEPIPPKKKWDMEQDRKNAEKLNAAKNQADDLAAFQAWKNNPDPASSSHLLRTIKPHIRKAINMHVGKSSPILESKAKRMALNALRRYDPDKGTALPTYLIGQLQGIKRVSRNQATGIKVPERDVRNAAIVSQKEAEFEDMHGYSPSVSQLADFSGLSEAKIDQIRSMSLPLHSTFFDNSGGEDESSFSPSIRNTAKEDMWKRIVYHDLDPINQKIMEWTMGIGGNPILQTQDIARRLRLSQGAISQRRKKIQDLLDKVG